MDKMDRMLGALPAEQASPDLAASVRRAVQRRHRRRLLVRRAAAACMAVLGLWLLWPAVAWLSSGALYASGAPWLAGGLDYLNYGSADMLGSLWNGTLSMQGAIGSAVAVSIWVGALLVCGSIFLALDMASWRSVSGWKEQGRSPRILARSLHA